MTKTKISISELKAANQMYFGKGNKRFFNDASYKIMYVKGLPFLLTYTAGFSDMFSGQKSYFYTAKPIHPETFKIGYMVEKNGNAQFREKESLKEHLSFLITTGTEFFKP